MTTNLAPRNLYESQIFSTLKQFTGERIVEYKLGLAVADEITKARTNFFASQTADIFKTPKGRRTMINTSDTTFECDLYMRINKPEVVTVVELLQGAVIDMQKLNSVADIRSAHDWLFIEVSLGPQFLAEKL